MPGVPRTAVFGVARIRPHFTDGLGGYLPATGSDAAATGFWIKVSTAPPELGVGETSSNLVFVTNKHVVDLRLSDPSTPYRLSRVDIELRGLREGSELDVPRVTKFFTVANLESCLFVAETADCAILCKPLWEDDTGLFAPPTAVSESMLATFDRFRSGDVELCEPVSFIGFPSTPRAKWWDQEWTLPIAREASIASLPDRPFKNEAIQTSDVVLVSGLSFNGSSGSPVFTHRKHVAVAGQWFDPLMGSVAVREPQLVGVMSGHFEHRAEPPEMFRHSGLSYMTRSTTVAELIAHARSLTFQNTNPFDGLNSVRTALVYNSTV